MSAYIKSPFKPAPRLLVAGTPEYLLGSYNDKTGPTFGYVISDSAVTTTGTVTFRIASGNVPFVGALITVVGTANAGGNFNVTNATILTVVCTDAGICTVTYAITSSSVAVGTADSGEVLVPQPEVAAALVTGASEPVALPAINSLNSQEHVITAVVAFPSLPTSVIVSLQQAVIDLDSEYADVAVVATVAGGVVTAAGGQITVDPVMARFLRFNAGTVTGGTLPSIVAKLIG
jgi:hypothetical protein